MNKLKTQIHKEFDEKFPNTLEAVVTDSGYGVNKKLKSFIDQSIDKAIAEERERIVEMIENQNNQTSRELYQRGKINYEELSAFNKIYNQGISDIIAVLDFMAEGSMKGDEAEKELHRCQMLNIEFVLDDIIKSLTK